MTSIKTTDQLEPTVFVISGGAGENEDEILNVL
jgi:hypothetical protein